MQDPRFRGDDFKLGSRADEGRCFLLDPDTLDRRVRGNDIGWGTRSPTLRAVAEPKIGEICGPVVS